MRVSTSFITLAVAIGAFAAPVSEDAALAARFDTCNLRPPMVCANSAVRRTVSPEKVKCSFSIYTGISCGSSEKRDVETRLLKVCGQDSKGNKVCAEKREELVARGISPSKVKCSYGFFTGLDCGDEVQADKREMETRLLKVCGQDSKGNKVCAEKREVELDARFLKVCGQDSKGNKVCAEKREELDARSITPDTVCGVDSKGNKVCASSQKREEFDARAINPSIVCGKDVKGNKVCADTPAHGRAFNPSVVCGQDSKGNKVCADSKSVILPSKVCGQDSKGNVVCADS